MAENYNPMGIGQNKLPCYICGKPAEDDMSAKVDDKTSGERVVAMYLEQGLYAKLDLSQNQVKVCACNAHVRNLVKLIELATKAGKKISPEIIKKSVAP